MWAIVTGASRGIGEEIVYRLSENYPDLRILATSRNIEGTETAQLFDPRRVTCLNADVATAAGRAAIFSALKGEKVLYLYNNAGRTDS
jgi:NAD(P)-dependent dehydrogenase (short-subunit alcohol dehydrogenase family)